MEYRQELKGPLLEGAIQLGTPDRSSGSWMAQPGSPLLRMTETPCTLLTRRGGQDGDPPGHLSNQNFWGLSHQLGPPTLVCAHA